MTAATMEAFRMFLPLRKLSVRSLLRLIAVLILCCIFYLYIMMSRSSESVLSTEPSKGKKCTLLRSDVLGDHGDLDVVEDGPEEDECERVGFCERKATPKLKSTFKAGAWRSWYDAPGYHKHYDVNCSGIIHNNTTVVRKAYEMVREERTQEGGILLPCDDTVAAWTKNCEAYRRNRRYPLQALSEEEDDYPIAYIIAAHKDAAELERLLRAIYQPQNVYCIHPDAKSSPAFHGAMRGLVGCFNNVFIASKIENVQYGGFSRVQADLNCMADLVAHDWNYVINLCAQDFPLKTNMEIVKQLKAYKDHNDIPGVHPEQTDWYVGRTRFKHQVVNGEVIRTSIKKPPPPHDAKMYFGNAYYVAGRPYVEHILNDNIAKDLLSYLSDSLSPDEHYWVTVNRYPGVPGGYPNSTWASNARFIRWTTSDYYAPCIGTYVRAVCVIGAGYLPYLSRQPHLFVNKLHYKFDPITFQCLEELLDYRTVFPDAISEFVLEFPVTSLFP